MAVGSAVPVQSNSSRKRERSVRGEFAPWLIASGRIAAWRSRRTQRNPAPFGRADPLVEVAGVVRGAEARRGRARACPARARRRRACRCPACRARRRSARSGSTSPVGLVTWSMSASRVRGVTAPRIASTTSSAERSGKGTAATTRGAAALRGTRQRVLRRVVGVIGGQQLVARLEVERGEHGVEAGRGVGDRCQVIGVGADEAAERGARRRPSQARGRGRRSGPAPLPCAPATRLGPRARRAAWRRTTRGSGRRPPGRASRAERTVMACATLW